MTYKSPIEIINEKVTESLENGVMKAVYKAEFLVDKHELYKALQYDRGQYEKGYADRDHEIVRCKDCKLYTDFLGANPNYHLCERLDAYRKADEFCSRAERKEDETD